LYNNKSIAIDGPAGAGKSTIAKLLAKKLRMMYVDTGAMYRTVAYKAIKDGVDLKDQSKLSSLVDNICIDIRYENNIQRMILDNVDVTELIRTKEVSRGAAFVAVVQNVRTLLVNLQRNLAEKYDVVMDGRDIGTYVLKNAYLKIYLTASLEERAMRRYKEMNNNDYTINEIKKDIQERDKIDSERELAPLTKADDAILIDSTKYSIEEVVDLIIGYYGERD